MQTWIWAAVVVALIVLAKTVWDVVLSRKQTALDKQEPEVRGVVHVDDIRVVSRADRIANRKKGVYMTALPPVVAEESVLGELPANEELETVRWSEPLLSEEELASNVISLESHKKALANDGYYDDEPVDPLALSQSQGRVIEAQEYVILYVVPSHVPFDGDRLLKASLGFGLRYGEMSMFHRHEHPNGQGEVLFSMARADDVGSFDLEAMTSEYVPAITLFMALPNQQPALAFDMMLDTAKRLAAELNGEVLDQTQNPLNRQLVEHYREYVLDSARRHQFMSVAV